MLMNSELISVVMPCYNASQYVAKAIESVKQQTVTRWELIVVDDASTDGSAEVARAAAGTDSRIRVLAMTTNGGAGVARNTGLAIAGGRWVSFLDCDDWWAPRKLERQWCFMREHKTPFTCSGYVVEDVGRVVRVVEGGQRVRQRDILINNVICTSGVMVDRTKFTRVQFDEQRSGQDLVLWYYLLAECKTAVVLGGTDVTYLRRRSSLSANKWRSAHGVWKIYRDKLTIPLPLRCFFFACYAWSGVRKHFLRV